MKPVDAIVSRQIRYSRMYHIEQTARFRDWHASLRDTIAKVRITARLRSAASGNFGDCRSVGEGVIEMRVDAGPGYRMYYTRIGVTIFMMLVGGDKSTQRRDITTAIQMAKELTL